MKIVIVGGVAGGATTAARLRRLNEKAEIILVERGNFISFANCGLPYYIGNVIKNKKDLLVQTPENFNSRFNIEVRVKQEVIKINRQEKNVLIKNIETNEEYEESYDKLVLSPGASPINPFKSLNSDKIRTLRNVEDSIEIKEYIEENNVENVAIIGGGYIGVELAENLSHFNNVKVTIIEKASHLIAPLDEDMSKFVYKVLANNGVNIILNNGVKEIINKNDKLNIELEDKNIDADFVVLCIGVKPEDDLAKQAGLKVYPKGGIEVNEKMQTDDEDIYALGDAVKIKNCVTGEMSSIPLAGPANKQARVVANNICNIYTSYDGSIGSSILKIFNYNLGITGINEIICKRNNIEYKTIILSPFSHATYYPGASMLTIKAIYEEKTGRILGAQVFGKDGVDKITDILATAIQTNMTAYDLEELDLCYAPPFSSAKSPVNLLGNSIVNQIEGLVETITWQEVEKITDKNTLILDVRTDEEYISGSYKNAIHIPLDNLRERLNELDKSKTYLVYCKTGLRSYIACRILSQNGFKVQNITGGYHFYSIISFIHEV